MGRKPSEAAGRVWRTVDKDRVAMRGSTQRKLFAGLCLLLFWQAGCAAFRPVHGVPARYLPTEMKLGDRSHRRTIDLSLLRQSPPTDPNTGKVIYRIDTGDVLGVYIEGFVGNLKDPPPVFFPQNGDAPSFGLPYPVRDDGTISLPWVGSLNLRGMTLVEAEERVKQAYLSPKQLINPDHHRVQVNLQRPRQYRVLVIRQDSRTEPQPNSMMGQLNIGMVKRGTGKVVNLPAYTNDVLNALTATDGLPGLDAEAAVIVIRGHGIAQGGALDPRWPTDLVPSLMMGGTQARETVIRAQSQDERGFLRSQDISQALYIGPRNRSVQQVAAAVPDGSRNAPHGFPPDGQIDAYTSLGPPAIWPDRAMLDPAAFNPSVGQGYSSGRVGPNARFTQFPADSVPPQPSGPGWNAADAGPMLGQPSPYYQAVPYNQPSPNNIVQPANPGGMNSDAPLHGTMPYGGQPGEPVPGAAQPWRPQPLNPQPLYSQPGTPQYDNAPRIRPGLDIPPGLDAGHGITGAPFVNGYNGQPLRHGIAGTPAIDGRHVIRIPIRLGPGETADIRPEDVVLYDGDIVFIESRDTEVFYTGGLLGGGQYTIPRDYDLDILQALSLAQSRGANGASRAVGGVSALNNDVAISPSTCIVLRKLPDGGEIPVKIDLYRARTDLSERIVIQPGDYILLQYTPLEAIAAFFERHLLETAIFGLAAQQFNKTSTSP